MLILKYENETLSFVENNIDSSDSIVKLLTDVDCNIFGIITLYNGAKRILQFIKSNDHYESKFSIDESTFNKLGNSYIHIELFNGELSQKSNQLKLSFDLEKIKNRLAAHLSDEVYELTKKIAKLDEKLSAALSSRILENIRITNKELIQPGMIPVAINGDSFVAMYPFNNHVVSVNGQTAADGAVIIDSSMIEYKEEGRTVEQTFEDHTSAITAIHNLLNEVIANQRQIRQKLDELEIRLDSHINNGIV